MPASGSRRRPGPRLMNAYLGSIVDRLRGTDLEPIEVDIRARLSDDADWERLTAPGSERLLPGDVIWNTVTDARPGGAAGRRGPCGRARSPRPERRWWFEASISVRR